MAKRTKTMIATIAEAKKIIGKVRKQRTSTIDQTLATASDGFKVLKKPTKTRTMVQTLKDALPVKTKKVTKKVKNGGKGKKGAKGGKSGKSKKGSKK